jgi:hypothetical protein
VTVSRRSPFATSRSACSSSSATCVFTTTRHFFRSMVWPYLAAVSSPIFHWPASASGPPGSPAPMESTPRPCLAADITPNGVMVLATAMGKCGSV